MTLQDGSQRSGQVLEVSGSKAVVQVLKSNGASDSFKLCVQIQCCRLFTQSDVNWFVLQQKVKLESHHRQKTIFFNTTVHVHVPVFVLN